MQSKPQNPLNASLVLSDSCPRYDKRHGRQLVLDTRDSGHVLTRSPFPVWRHSVSVAEETAIATRQTPFCTRAGVRHSSAASLAVSLNALTCRRSAVRHIEVVSTMVSLSAVPGAATLRRPVALVLPWHRHHTFRHFTVRMRFRRFETAYIPRHEKAYRMGYRSPHRGSSSNTRRVGVDSPLPGILVHLSPDATRLGS